MYDIYISVNLVLRNTFPKNRSIRFLYRFSSSARITQHYTVCVVLNGDLFVVVKLLR